MLMILLIFIKMVIFLDVRCNYWILLRINHNIRLLLGLLCIELMRVRMGGGVRKWFPLISISIIIIMLIVYSY